MDAKLEKISYDGDVEALDLYLQKYKHILDTLAITPCLPNNPLHIAASRGDVKFVKVVVHHKSELANKFNEDGYNALHLAAANGSVEVVKEILAAVGCNLCLVHDKDGLLPIHHAALKGKIEVLQELLDVCEETAKQMTCLMDTILHLAVRSNCIEVLKFLIERMDIDAKFLNAKNIRGNTILHLAVAGKQLQTVKFLVNQQGIDVNAANLKSLTPLDVLKESPLQTGDDEIQAVLLEVNGIMTFSYSTIHLTYEKTAFAEQEIASEVEKNHIPMEHQSTYTKISSIIRTLLEYILLRAECRAALLMRILSIVAGKHDSNRNVNLVMNVLLRATFTYLAIIYIPRFCGEPFEDKLRMLFAVILGLGSIFMFIFCVIRPRVFTIKTTALSIFIGSLIAILQILPEHDRTKMSIFITAHFQLALCLQQLKKIEKTSRQANFSRTNTRALHIARTAKFVTVAFISFAAANYCCFRVYRTTFLAKAVPHNTA